MVIFDMSEMADKVRRGISFAAPTSLCQWTEFRTTDFHSDRAQLALSLAFPYLCSLV